MWFEKRKPLIVLAPMADLTDSPFCEITRKVSGKEFIIFREMVSAEALVRGSEKTNKMCEFKSVERPIVLQIFGAAPRVMVEAAQIIVKKYKPDGIDINMGCPVPKITRKVSAGAALLKDPEKACQIVAAVKKAVPKTPVSVKTRLGWSDPKEILMFAPKIEAAGANLITVHGRTKAQGYSGEANWDMIAKVVETVNIPVIANGDIKNSDDINKCLDITKSAGVMIGRAALGNPWIFKRTNKDVSFIERKRVVFRHAKTHISHYGEEYGLITFRKHLLYYFKNIPGIKKYKPDLAKVSSLKELKYVLKNITLVK